MGVTKIGATLTSLAALSFAMSAFVFSKVQEKVGLTLTAALGLTIVSCGLLGVGAATCETQAIAAAAVYVCGIPLFTPAVPILLMQCVPKTQRGAVMGADSAVNAAARIAAPFLFGKLCVFCPISQIQRLFDAPVWCTTAVTLTRTGNSYAYITNACVTVRVLLSTG